MNKINEMKNQLLKKNNLVIRGGVMGIPDFQTAMLPLLRFMGDEKEHSIQEIVNSLAKEFNLSFQELSELLSSGKQTVFYNRVTWARIYLSKSSHTPHFLDLAGSRDPV